MAVRGVMLLVVCTIVASFAAAAPAQPSGGWSQYGGDAANSGHGSDGPVLPEVALRVELPLGRAIYAAPLVVGRVAYVLSAPMPDAPEVAQQGIHAVDLDSGDILGSVPIDARPTAFAATETGFVVATEQDVRQVSWPEGDPLWSVGHPEVAASGHRTSCPFLKVQEGVGYVACLSQGGEVGNPVYGESGEVFSVLFVRAIDLGSGEMLWSWTKDAAGQFGLMDPADGALASTGTPFVTYLNGLAVIGPYAILTGIDGLGERGVAEVYAWALDAETGAPLWRRADEVDDVVAKDTVFRNAAEPTGTVTAVYLKLGDLIAVNPARNTEIWRRSVGESDSGTSQNMGTGLALADDALFAASRETLYRFHATGREDGWSVTLDPARDQLWTSTHLSVAEGVVYARARSATDIANQTMYAFDAETGARLWEVPLVHDGPGFADLQFMTSLGSGTLIAAGTDGSLHVLGRTDASIRITPHVDDRYPAVGEAVRLDASKTRAGVQGPADAWRVIWGDGTVSEWTATPLFTHAFAKGGTHQVIVQARNDAGQIGAATLEVAVDGTPPPTLSFLQWVFAPAHQDLLWGALGVAIALIGGLWTYLRRRQRRRVIQRALRRIQDVATRYGADPVALAHALEAERNQVRGLFLTDRIDESQAAAIEQRIDALERTARLRVVDERLAFLPHSFVVRLRRVLGDGTITAAEHEDLLRLVDDTPGLSEEQRVEVRRVVGQWRAGDAADEG